MVLTMGSTSQFVLCFVTVHVGWVSDNRNCLGECQLELEKLRANHGIRMVLPLESRPDMTEPVSGSVTVEVRL